MSVGTLAGNSPIALSSLLKGIMEKNMTNRLILFKIFTEVEFYGENYEIIIKNRKIIIKNRNIEKLITIAL